MKKGGVSYEVPNNVQEFLDKASRRYGQIKEDEFSQLLWARCRGIQSPIEQLFLIALNLVCEENLIFIEERGEFWEGNDDLQVIHQWAAGTYFVDFALKRFPQADQIVCIELDGHAFHDRDERQRRYEKRRDRFLTSAGYKTLHFTGSEVAKDPCAVALEAFNLATGLGDASTHPFEKD